MESGNKKPNGVGFLRIKRALFCSIDGIKAAWNNEQAFRQEVFLFILLTPAALVLGTTGLEKSFMISSLLLVLIIEIINTAIEAVVDRISSKHHTLSGLAKDLGSAAVTLALFNCVVVWAFIIIK
jgi:diacylglycerol kinase (ATP)